MCAEQGGGNRLCVQHSGKSGQDGTLRCDNPGYHFVPRWEMAIEDNNITGVQGGPRRPLQILNEAGNEGLMFTEQMLS